MLMVDERLVLVIAMGLRYCMLDGRVDFGILRILTDSEITQLIPVPGHPAKFKENLKNRKKELNNLYTVSNEPSLSFSFSDLGVELINNEDQPSAATSSIVLQDNLQCKDILCAQNTTEDKQFEGGYVLKTLQSTLDVRAILNKRDTGKLEETQRNLLVKLLIEPIIEKNPNIQITNKQLLSWSLQIQEIFNKESAALYYTPYVSALVHTTARNASGKLLRYIYNKRRQLRERGIIERSARSRSSLRSTSSVEVAPLISLPAACAEATEEVTEKLMWLRNSLEPWQLVKSNWSQTASYRLSKHYLLGSTLQQLFNEYPVLKLPSGYNLLLDDFEYLYKDKTDCLYSKITVLRDRIHLHAQNRITSIRDKEVKQTIENYLKTIEDSEDPESKNNAALLLLPYITSSIPLKQRKKPQWKPSKSEIRDGFITQIASDADLENTVSMRRKKLERYGKTLQPFVIFVGPSISNISHCFVVVGDTYYRINKLLTAVDVCFKIIHATGARYQEEAIVVWMNIQRVFYDIVTPYDKEFTSVKSLLLDLTL